MPTTGEIKNPCTFLKETPPPSWPFPVVCLTAIFAKIGVEPAYKN